MTPKQHLIEAFRALCERQGGHVAVADAIGANEQALWQVLAGTKLPSGEPRGVGPGLQRKLEDHFPGWASRAGAQTHPLHADTLDALARAAPETRLRIENATRAMLGMDPLRSAAVDPVAASVKRRAGDR